MYKIVQVNNCYSRISRNCAKANRYKIRFFDAKFLDEHAKARSEGLTKRFLRINSRARAILERIEASCSVADLGLANREGQPENLAN